MSHFLDTHILLYQFDDQQPVKRDLARSLVRSSLDNGDGICSTQVVNEFCNLALRHFAVPMTPAQCAMYLDAVLTPLCTAGWSQTLVREALRIVERWKTSWYDALIILYSEDLQHDTRFGQLRVVNPFRAI